MTKAKILSILSMLKSSKTALISTVLMLILILGFLISMFVGATSDDSTWVFKIGSHHVSRSEFEKGVLKLKKVERNIGKSDQEIKLMALNTMAVEFATKKELEKYGIKIDDEIVSLIIQSDENFFKDGKFDKNVFKNFLQSRGITEADFFKYTKSQLSSQIVLSFGENFISNDKSVAEIIERSRNQKRKFEIYSLKLNDVTVDTNVEKREQSKFFNDNKSLFKNPDRKKIFYISGVDIKSKIKYNPPVDQLNSLLESRKDLSSRQVNEFLTNSYVCKIIGDIAKSITNYDVLKSVSESYGVKIYEKNLIFDEKTKQTKYKELSDIQKGKIGFVFDDRAECYQVEIAYVEENDDMNYKTFEESIGQINQEIIKKRRLEKIEDISKNFKDSASDNIDGTSGLSFILSNGFKKTETKEAKRDDDVLGKNQAILENAFMTRKNELSSFINDGEVYYVVRVLDIINFTGDLNKEKVLEIEKKIHISKISDIYKLYYMDLQDKYDIQINELYFRTNVVK